MATNFGITNITSVTIENITAVGNVTDPAQFFINVNEIIYMGWLYFILCFLFWIILFINAEKRNDQILNNLMYSGAVVSIVSFFLRAIFVTTMGVTQGLLTDFQLWIFPIITAVLAAVIWATKEGQ